MNKAYHLQQIKAELKKMEEEVQSKRKVSSSIVLRLIAILYDLCSMIEV